MATTASLPQDGVEASSVERWITTETLALASELFCSTYGLDRDGAWNQAIELLPELLTWAAEWDRDAASLVVFALETDHATA